MRPDTTVPSPPLSVASDFPNHELWCNMCQDLHRYMDMSIVVKVVALDLAAFLAFSASCGQAPCDRPLMSMRLRADDTSTKETWKANGQVLQLSATGSLPQVSARRLGDIRQDRLFGVLDRRRPAHRRPQAGRQQRQAHRLFLRHVHCRVQRRDRREMDAGDAGQGRRGGRRGMRAVASGTRCAAPRQGSSSSGPTAVHT